MAHCAIASEFLLHPNRGSKEVGDPFTTCAFFIRSARDRCDCRLANCQVLLDQVGSPVRCLKTRGGRMACAELFLRCAAQTRFRFTISIPEAVGVNFRWYTKAIAKCMVESDALQFAYVGRSRRGPFPGSLFAKRSRLESQLASQC